LAVGTNAEVLTVKGTAHGNIIAFMPFRNLKKLCYEIGQEADCKKQIMTIKNNAAELTTLVLLVSKDKNAKWIQNIKMELTSSFQQIDVQQK
jgi:hypothetical protein